MPEMLPFLLFALALLALALFGLRRVQLERNALKSDLDLVQNDNRMLQDERERLKVGVESLKLRLAETEETAARLEKARAEMEARLAALMSEHQALEKRVLAFQGDWSHQLTTLEEEIATLLRQLGEFRKGTQLPIQGTS